MMNLLEASKKSEKKSFFKTFWKYFKRSFFSKKNLKRDLTIWGTVLIIVGLYFGLEKYFSLINFDKNKSENIEEVVEEEPSESISSIQARIDTQNWKPYQNTWYGFELKYPDNWNQPTLEKSVAGSKWEQKIKFRFEQNDIYNPSEGFDVLIYDVSKIKELSATDEFPKLKNTELISENSCFTINDHLLETGDYPAEEIYIPADDNCYNAVLFFTNTRGEYIYNIIPKIKEAEGVMGDPQKEVAKYMPEFFATISTWQLIDIQRPKPKPAVVFKPKPSAPMPVSYKKVNGLRVCAKKNDKPGKSKQGKSKHLDMECCLDPDEYPNPHCYYDPKKYGKYL